MTTTEKIFELIRDNNLTAKEFAYICDLSQGNVTDWKTGRSKPSIEAIKKISNAFNIKIDWLLSESYKKEKDNVDNDLKFPDDFKYYIEDLPDFLVYKIKFITHILLIVNTDYEDIGRQVDFELSAHRIPLRFKKDSKKAIIHLYNYNINSIIKSNKYVNIFKRQTKFDNINDFYMCPVYGQISAGIPNWVEENIEGYLPIDPILFNIVDPEECFFLRVNGESMNKVIKNGAYALIRKQDIVENGEIAAVLVNGYDATLKKFSKQGDLVVLEPMSDDSSFQVQIYDKNTPIQILGKYIGKFEMK